MALTLADTDVLIDLAHGRPQATVALRTLRLAGTLATSTVTVFELLSGARTPDELRRYEDLVLPIPVLRLTIQAARQAAAVSRSLRGAGLGIGERDTLIAGIALANGCRLLTRNVRHFERVPGLDVVTI